nr:helix-turn-helix domain-containing protein [Thiohalomonas denitrificans]
MSEIPQKQCRAPPKSLRHYARKFPDRGSAIAAAYASGGYSLKEIGEHFGLHYSYIRRIINRQGMQKERPGPSIRH